MNVMMNTTNPMDLPARAEAPRSAPGRRRRAIARLAAAAIACALGCGYPAIAQTSGDLSHGIPASMPATPDGRAGFGFLGLDIPPAIEQVTASARTVQLIAEALRQPRVPVAQRVILVADLGRTRRADAGRFIVDAMGDPSPLVRAQAAIAAAQIDDPAMAGAVDRLLADADASVRAAAVRAADALDPERPAASPAVVNALADGEPVVRRAAIAAIRTSASAAVLAHRLSTSTLPDDEQIAAIAAIGRFGHADLADAIAPFIQKDLPHRVAAIQALGEMKAAAQLDAVVAELSHAHPTVRRIALIALSTIAPAELRQAKARAMLADADPSVRAAAADALAPTPDADAAAAMVQLLSDPYRPLHAALRKTLVHPASDAARDATVTAVVPMLGDANPRRREDASYVLGRLKSDVALDKHTVLAEWTDGADVDVCAQAAESLGLIGDPKAKPALLALSARAKPGSMGSPGDPAAKATLRAFVALGHFGDARVIPDAMRLLAGDPMFTPGDSRAAAAYAIGATAPRGDGAAVNRLRSLLNSDLEGTETRAESAKGLANLHAIAAIADLRKVEQSAYAPVLAWAAHWAADRLSGETTPYHSPVHSSTPDVSIEPFPR